MTLRERIQTIQGRLREGDYPHENSISRQIVEPILRDLGWPTDDAGVVKYEYPPDGKKTRVDIALFCEDRPQVFIEVKQQTNVTGAEKQLFNYAHPAGVPLAILTTGQDWRFYLPMAEGSYPERNYQDRQVYTLDISVLEIEESAERLERYLLYENVQSGQAKKNAEEDHKTKVIQDILSRAWQDMLSGGDNQLIKIVQERVGNMCVFRPGDEVVAEFIRDKSENAVKSSEGTGQKMVGFELTCRPGSSADTLQALYEEMIRRDPSFPDRFAALPEHGTTRRWLARERDDLFPREHYKDGIPDNPGGSLRQLSSGHWFNTFDSAWHKGKIPKAICEVANIRPEDLRLLWED